MISEETYENLIEDFNLSQDSFVLKVSTSNEYIIDIFDKNKNVKIGECDGDLVFTSHMSKSVNDNICIIACDDIDISFNEVNEFHKLVHSVKLILSGLAYDRTRKVNNKSNKTVKAFRAWNNIVNKYMEDYITTDPYCNNIYASYDGDIGISNNMFIEPCSWRKDNTGTFIYDGDIVEIEFSDRSKVTYNVIFNDGEWIYKNRLDEKEYDYEDMCDDIYTMKIIGNVHTFSIDGEDGW